MNYEERQERLGLYSSHLMAMADYDEECRAFSLHSDADILLVPFLVGMNGSETTLQSPMYSPKSSLDNLCFASQRIRDNTLP